MCSAMQAVVISDQPEGDQGEWIAQNWFFSFLLQQVSWSPSLRFGLKKWKKKMYKSSNCKKSHMAKVAVGT